MNASITLEIFSNLISNLTLPKDVVFIDENLAYALLNEFWQHITTYLDFRLLLECKTVVAVFSPDNSHIHLLVLNMSNFEYFIIDPQSYVVKAHPKCCGLALVKAILKHNHVFETPNEIDAPLHEVISSGIYNYLIIYGTIIGIFTNQIFSKLNMAEISQRVLFQNLIPPKPITKPKASSATLKEDFNNITKRRKFAKDLIECNLDATVDEWFDLILESILMKRPVKRESKPYLGNKSRDAVSTSKWELRHKYSMDRKSTVRKLLSSDEVCEFPSIESIVTHFTRSIPPVTNWSNAPRLGHTHYYPAVIFEITSQEVLYALKRTSKSAPGEDGILYSDLKSLDPDGIILCHWFNLIFNSARAPKKWKHFSTVLIPKPGKSGEYNDINNWRPIALLSTTYKIFASILANRLSKWVKKHKGLMHPLQKANYEFEGCAQHTACLSGILEHRKVHGNSLNIAWLDIADAFGSVPHEYLWGLLRRHELCDKFILMLNRLYMDTSTSYSCGHIKTPSISINVGVKQGCPLSMLLFSLAINPVLEAIEDVEYKGYQIDGLTTSILAYADDLALVCERESALQPMLDAAVSIAGWAGLKFRPNKCATLTIPDTNTSNYQINGVTLPRIKEKEAYKYLGVPIGLDNDQTPYPILIKMLSDSEIIAASDLFPWQKLDAIKTFIHPRILYAMRTREIKMGALSNSHATSGETVNLQIDQKLTLLYKKPHSKEMNQVTITVTENGFKKDGIDPGFSDVTAAFENADPDDDEYPDPTEGSIGGKIQVRLSDMDLPSWEHDLQEDLRVIAALLAEMHKITPDQDAKLQHLKTQINSKISSPINPGNRKILLFTAFSDTAEYLYKHLAPNLLRDHKVHSGIVTGSSGPICTLKKGFDFQSVLTLFSPRSKEKSLAMPKEPGEIDILIATDCISEGQNLQDCDYLINYDIHWNPVRIIQRFGRIDRIGSPNTQIQLVNFWPNIELEEYINLEQRVSGRMVLLDISATGEENIIEQQTNNQMNDLEYRRKQLLKLQDAVIDLEHRIRALGNVEPVALLEAVVKIARRQTRRNVVSCLWRRRYTLNADPISVTHQRAI